MHLSARAEELLLEGGTVRGLVYRDSTSARVSVAADLVVGADGRFSRIRRLAGLIPSRAPQPVEYL
ncbi:MAG: hypothetical protein JO352_24550 [Chloroflexi bacterium]|nr:hypothetical protein [Chloroflexota bacterium]